MRSESNNEIEARRRAMGIVARCSGAQLRARLAGLDRLPAHDEIRAPQSGLVMLRGRIGGSGAPFNFGEATLTRAAVRLDSGEIGASYCLGRDHAKARDAALVDALWQRSDWRPRVEQHVIAPLAEMLADTDARRAAETAATRVDFFTLVRGED